MESSIDRTKISEKDEVSVNGKVVHRAKRKKDGLYRFNKQNCLYY